MHYRTGSAVAAASGTTWRDPLNV
ncbi:hypothetical protein CBM2592_A100040 [Cupriavidus taiwanensis]|nr:hypothetical protein CBM2592_A100040 [Cupriavidus taiwanensis]SOY80024.1 hypothetical protein CBM2591_A110039 [Cupriavidus taiwanensis]SOZ50579.1 hypothetical protein CBM2617_A100040 [Cupriavidus taiwanensis]SOZ75837.1 hypothetical protein CBM2622_A100040 [Cupriavidus taiwanensis]SOZ76726.1 hypothetical protein CBM2618_A110040 [Cupriavidus taiwanensis]